MNEINKKTVTTDVSASLWWSANASGTVYLKLEYSQPGNWNGTAISTYVNGSVSGLHAHAPVRPMGYGTAKGNDIVGAKRYELSNHLGNVLAVISDRKWGVDDGVYNTSTGVKTSSTADGAIDYYLPTIIAYSDYDPFGTIQDGRKGGASDYRYGFQGQEADDEVKGEGNSLNYEYRMHDPRIGRFFAIDPLAPKYPFYTPYQFSGNRPIDCMELEGLEPMPAVYSQTENGVPIEDVYRDYSETGESMTDNGCWGPEGGPIEGCNTYTITFKEWLSTDDPRYQKYLAGGWDPVTDNGWTTMSNDPWSPNYGIWVDRNGWPLQDWKKSPNRHYFDGAEFFLLYAKVIGGGSALALGTIFTGGAILEYAPAGYAWLTASSTTVGASGTLTTTTTFTQMTTITTGSVGSSYVLTSLPRTGADVSGQAFINGWENVQYGDAIATGWTPPPLAALYSGTNDDFLFNPRRQSRSFFDGTKSATESLYDGTFKYMFSSDGTVGAYTNNVLNFTTQKLPQVIRPYASPIINLQFSIGGKYTTKQLKPTGL